MEVDVNIYRNRDNDWILVDVRSFDNSKMLTVDLIIIDMWTGLPIKETIEDIDEYNWEKVEGVLL